MGNPMTITLNGTTGITTPALDSVASFSSADMPAGSVLQVLQFVYSGANVTATSGTPIATGLSISITPTSASSKILVLCNPNWAVNSAGAADGVSMGYIYRNGTNIYNLYNRIYTYGNSNGVYKNGGHSLVYLDSPTTTSAIIYEFYMSLLAGSSGQIQGDGGSSSITVLEIAA